MAYKDFDGLSLGNDSSHTQNTISSNGHTVELPDASFVRDASFSREGMDLVMKGPTGELTVENYFADESSPNLVAPDGSTLTPDLVQSFMHSPAQYAGTDTASDVSPVGAVEEVTGHATVTRTDGTSETIQNGTPIFEGDVVETDASGAVNIKFVDDTSFAVSEDARLAIDEYVYDPSTQSGSNNFSVLKGVFVFTSGLIGRDDPDDVHIETPVGSIGIRGTIIAGNVNSGEITVVEGAIVLTDHNGHEMTLATQFETARFHGSEGIEHMGQLAAQEVAQKFFVVSQVSPTLFSSINDAAAEQTQDAPSEGEQPAAEDAPAQDSQKSKSPETQNGDDHSANSPAAAPAGEAAPAQAAAVTAPAAEVAPVATAVPTPVPAPVTVALQTVTSFGTSAATTGLNSSAPTVSITNDISSQSKTSTHSVAETISTTAIAATKPVAPPPVHETAPPKVIAPATITNTNQAPTHDPEAPVDGSRDVFFASIEGQSWNYHFNKEFSDDGGVTNLRFELSAATINSLNALKTSNGGSILTGWNFVDTTGELQFNFASDFGGAVPTGSALNFNIEVRAVDNNGTGLASNYESYSFTAYNPDSTFKPGIFDNTNYGTKILAPAYTATNYSATIQTDGSKYFISHSTSGSGTFTLDSGAENNILNLANSINNVIITTTAVGNEIVGGDLNDKFTLNNAKVKIYGMDGDDDFGLNLDSNSSTFLSDLQTFGSNMVIDGGHSNFQAAESLRNEGINVLGEGVGRGDSLILQNAGTLDFSAINSNNKFTSIERIDAATDTGAQIIILNYNDILNITDEKNTLVINLGAGDTLNLSGMNLNGVNGMSKKENDLMINDAKNGETASDKAYDVYSDGHVTLLIHNNGGANVSFDGTAVAV